MRPPISINSQRTQYQSYNWQYQGKSFKIAYETLGQGDPVLLLPAFSTVSSRTELAGIAQILAPHVQVMALDWLGFGESDRPPIHYNRSLYQQLLQDFVRDCCPHPLAIIAAGHAAGYAMQLAQQQPGVCAKLLLAAPTWKGPLRAMGVPVFMASGIRNLVRSPLLGQGLYALKTHPALLVLDLHDHILGSSGASCIGMALNFNSTLQDLGVRGNDGGDECVHFFAEAIKW